MNIAFFISDHGFGHMMRCLPVMKRLVECGHHVTAVSGQRQIEQARLYLKNSDIVYYSMQTDAGIAVKAGSLEMDIHATEKKVREMIIRWGELEAFAGKIISENRIDRSVIDIVPWALTATKKLGIPSYLMANFTWCEQYDGILSEEVSSFIRNVYDNNADNVLLLDLANMPTIKRYPNGIPAGFVCRPWDDEEVRLIREKAKEKEIVFMALGASNQGLDFEINVEELPYYFIATSAVHLKGENVLKLPVETDNTQDYIKACDYCITKAGWTTVSEIMVAHAKCALIERKDVPEDTMIIDEIKRRKAAISISVDELKDIGNVIQRMKNYKYCKKRYKNQTEGLRVIIESLY